MTSLDTVLDGWRAFHWHYHAPLDRLLVEAIRPLLIDLWHDGSIDRFFFIRYGVGGPHVRLRVRVVAPNVEASVSERVHQSAERFFASAPSTESISDDEIREQTERVASSDPNESIVEPVADNTCIDAAFVPEVERYGGVERLAASFDAFTGSSVLALDELVRTRDATWGRRLPGAFCLLAGLTLGLASDRKSWLDHVAYAERWWSESPLAAIFDKADAVYSRQETTFAGLWQSEIDRLAGDLQGSAAPSAAFHIGRDLALAVADAPLAVRYRIAESQLHMTANRLGLSNINEAYLGRLLAQSARALNEADLAALEPWPGAASPGADGGLTAWIDERWPDLSDEATPPGR